MGRRSETPSAAEENDDEVPTTGRTPRAAASKRKSLKEVDEESDEEVVSPSRKRKPKDDDEKEAVKDEEPSEADAEESEDEATTSKPSSSKKKRNASKKVEPIDDADESEESEDEATTPKPSSSKKKRKASKKVEPIDDADESEDEPENSEDEPENSENEENEKPLPKKSGRKKKATSAKDEDPEYEVEKIVDDRAIKGRIQYKIRWKGYLSEDDTWENESTLDCTELIEEYNDIKGDDARDNGSPDPPAAKSQKSKRAPSKNDPKKDKKQAAAASEKKSGKSSRYGRNAPEPSGEWEVSRLIDMHTLKNGRREFLVRWKGYPPEDDSWEPEEHLKGTDILEKFLKKVEQTDTPSQSGSRRTAMVNYKAEEEEDEESIEDETVTTRKRLGRPRKTQNGHQSEDAKPVSGGVTLAELEKCFNAVIDKKRLAKQDKLDELLESVRQLKKENKNLRKTVEDLQNKIAK